MLRTVTVVGVLLLVLGYGVAEGLWTDRWFTSPELAQGPARLARLPKDVGPWQGEDLEMDQRVVRRAEVNGHVQRRFVHRHTGEALTVLAVCGRPGPVSVHSPQVCLPGAGFVPHEERQRAPVEGAEFWAERYHKERAQVPEVLQIYYGWNAGTRWEAVDHPRLYFPAARVLFKLYVSRNLPRADEPAADDPIPGFLRLFVPEFNRCLAENP